MPSAGQNGEQREKSSTFLMPESQADMMKIQQRRAEKKALKAEKKAEKKAAKKAAKVAKKSRKNSRSASSEEGGSEVDQVDHHQPLMTGPSQSQLETTSQARLELSLNTTPGQEEEDHLQESNQESEDGESKVEDEEDGETVVVPNR